MDEQIQVPDLEMVSVFRTVMEEEYAKHRDMLQDLPPDTAGSFTRRLAAICNAVSEGLLKNTTYQWTAHRSRDTPSAPVLTLSSTCKDEIQTEKALESRRLQSTLVAALESAEQSSRASAAAFLSALKSFQVADPSDNPKKSPLPDLETALKEAYDERVFEKDMKEKIIKTMRVVNGDQVGTGRALTTVESRVYEKMYWSP